MDKKKICMIVQDKMVKGGIAAVISGYYGSVLEDDYEMIYVESYADGSKIEKLVKAITGYATFMKVLIWNRPDIVHIHSSFGPSFYRKLPFILLSRLFKRPIINHIHGADFNEFYINASKTKQKLIKYAYRKCTKLIALSDEWYERLSQIVKPDRVVVIENYSVLHEDEAIRKGKRPLNKIVLFLGELGKRKGCYDIPDVINKVSNRIDDVMFVLAGTGTKEDEENIKKKIVKLNVSDNVRFPGWVRNEKKHELLSETDIFFLPSYNEGMPMSILDAMGYGIPIVSTDVGGIPRIVQTGLNGYCCVPGDTDAMSEVIVQLLENKEKNNSMGWESFKIVKTRYSLEAHLKRIEALYKCVLGEQ